MTLEGAQVQVVAELMPYSGGLKRNIVQCLDDYGIPLKLSHTVVDIQGKERVEGITLAQVENGKPIPGTEEHYDCDTLLLSVGLIPENELSKAVGVELSPVTNGPTVNESLETSIPGVFACAPLPSACAERRGAFQRVAKAPRSRGNPFLRAVARQKFLPPSSLASVSQKRHAPGGTHFCAQSRDRNSFPLALLRLADFRGAPRWALAKTGALRQPRLRCFVHWTRLARLPERCASRAFAASSTGRAWRGCPLGTKFSAEPCTRRKAARTLSALHFPVCVPSIRTCRLDGTFFNSMGPAGSGFFFCAFGKENGGF